jgi:hypothetical protein
MFCQERYILYSASSGIADKLRTAAWPIPSKLTDKIGEQATPSDPGKNAKRYPWSPCWYRVSIIVMVPSANTKRDTMDYLFSYKWINQGSKQKMNTTQRVSVNAHKRMSLPSITIKSHRMLKTRIQVGGKTSWYNPTILISISILSNITLNWW